jgi:flagellar export protein FliJ
MPSARVRRIGKIRALKQSALDDRSKELAAAREGLVSAERALAECVTKRVHALAAIDQGRSKGVAPEEWRQLDAWLETTKIRELAQRQRVAAHENAVELARQAVVAAQSEVKRLDELVSRIREQELAVETSKERKLEDELAGRKRVS